MVGCTVGSYRHLLDFAVNWAYFFQKTAGRQSNVTDWRDMPVQNVVYIFSEAFQSSTFISSMHALSISRFLSAWHVLHALHLGRFFGTRWYAI